MAEKWSKKWYISIGILMVVVLAAGITLALLVSNTNKEANVFRFGDIDMELTEANWESDQQKVSSTYEIPKDPQIVNTGAADFYAYLEIQVPKRTVRTANADGSMNAAAMTELFSYEVNNGWISLESDDTDSSYNTYLYGYADVVAAGAATTTLFDSVTFADIIEGDVAEGTVLSIQVNAYAIQADYLDGMGDLSSAKDKLEAAWQLYQEEEAR